MKVYISGQITGLILEDAIKNFDIASDEITEMGHDYSNPMHILPYHPQHNWTDYMLADIEELFDCDAIYMLRNWPHSKGARIERAIAHEMGLQIIYQ